MDARRQTLDASPIHYTPPHLAERIRAKQAALEQRALPEGERKTITALFADLKGSTALIEGLDPEETRAIIDPAYAALRFAVTTSMSFCWGKGDLFVERVGEDVLEHLIPLRRLRGHAECPQHYRREKGSSDFSS